MEIVDKRKGDPYFFLFRELEKERYHIIGTHGAYKKCHWTHETIKNGRGCYKSKFYGIESNRCVQMTPSALWCWFRCEHCWRLEPEDVDIEWDDTKIPSPDDPEILAEKSIEEHRKSVAGYTGMKDVKRKFAEDAMRPNHVAISLTGEPTLYERIGGLIREYHKRGMTTFLVTSGVRPDVLANLEEEPSQLFISIQAPNPYKHKIFNRPIVANSWKLVMDTLDMLPSFSCPTVIRLTVVKGFNMSDKDIQEFADLFKRAMPTYIEVKGYMHVGPSTLRMSRSAMPTHDEVREFSLKLSKLMGYNILSEHVPSRIVLLSSLESPMKIGSAWNEKWNWRIKDDDREREEYQLANNGCTEGLM